MRAAVRRSPAWTCATTSRGSRPRHGDPRALTIRSSATTRSNCSRSWARSSSSTPRTSRTSSSRPRSPRRCWPREPRRGHAGAARGARRRARRRGRRAHDRLHPRLPGPDHALRVGRDLGAAGAGSADAQLHHDHGARRARPLRRARAARPRRAPQRAHRRTRSRKSCCSARSTAAYPPRTRPSRQRSASWTTGRK